MTTTTFFARDKTSGKWLVALPNRVPAGQHVEVTKKDGTKTTVVIEKLVWANEFRSHYSFTNVPPAPVARGRSFGEVVEAEERIHDRYQQFLGEHAGHDRYTCAADDGDEDPFDFDEADRYDPISDY